MQTQNIISLFPRRICSIILLMGFCLTVSPPVHSATIFLKDGREVKTDKYWSLDGFVQFQYNGMITKIPQNRVDRIEEDVAPPESGATRKGRDRNKALSPSPEHTKTALDKALSDKKMTIARPPAPEKPFRGDTEYLTTIIAAISKYKKEVGFRGLFWASTVYDIYGLEKVGEEPLYGGVDKYVNTLDKLKFGDANLEKIVYGFWKNQFLSVTLWVDGESNYQALREETFKRFGKGRKSSSGEERHIWIGGASDKYLEFDTPTEKGLLWFRNHDLWKQIKREYPQTLP